MGRVQQEQLAQQVAQRSMMPSMTDQVAYLRAQLAHRDALIEQVRVERDDHFVQEEEKVLAHMRLLSSEAKNWKSRVVTEAEGVLCRESPQLRGNCKEENMVEVNFATIEAHVLGDDRLQRCQRSQTDIRT